MKKDKSGITILGVFVADTAYIANKMPAIGETILGTDFSIGPGGKGSNQAVAAARAGGEVNFISKIGADNFGEIALKTYKDVGVKPYLTIMDDMQTGAAFIFVDENSGDNAIIVYSGAAGSISIEDVEARRDIIEGSKVFVVQLEQPLEAAIAGLKIAKQAGVTTVLNPAPAKTLPDEIFPLCDFIIPNEIEAEALVGFAVQSQNDAQKAGQILLDKGVENVIITMGEKGAYLYSNGNAQLVPAKSSGQVIDTAGAGDAFIGGFATAISKDAANIEAMQFGCATAGIAVTRRGTAASMPTQQDIIQLLEKEVKHNA